MENPELVRLLLVGEDPVYQIADNMPEFPGGMIACLQYLARNIKYPVTAQKEGAQGKVIVQMVIEKDGFGRPCKHSTQHYPRTGC